jgi:hypothetical protein
VYDGDPHFRIEYDQPVFSRRVNPCRGARRIDAIAEVRRATCNREAHAAADEPQERLRQQVDVGRMVEGQDAAVGEEDLESALRRAQPISSEQRDIFFGRFDQAVPLEVSGAIDH